MSERFSPSILRLSGVIARLVCIAAILAGCALPRAPSHAYPCDTPTARDAHCGRRVER
jgi:hypothetical protein